MGTHDAIWWKHGVVYQIYPRSYMDSNGDGIGDLDGITSRLDHVRDMGFEAIWLSPIYPSPMKDFGYDVSDYCDIHPDFGDLAAFDRMLAAAHERGIKVMIDWVPNHTSDQHPWFVGSRSSRDNPKRDWYIWRDAKPDGSPPNNWPCAFGGSPWEWDAKTGQYYLHSFLPEQPDLNWRNPEVVAAMHDVMRFWLDRGVDGLRIDVIYYLLKDEQFQDNPPDPDIAEELRGRVYPWLRVFDSNHPRVHDLIKDFRRLMDEYDDRAMVGEVYLLDMKQWVPYLGNGRDQLHTAFNFRFMHIPWQAAALRQVIEDMEAVLPSEGWPAVAFGSHDEPRFISRWGEKNARAAALLLLTLRATPFVYYGEEIGMKQAPISMEEMQDPIARRMSNLKLGRDGCRTPMQWTPDLYAGFSTAKPWLPLGADYQRVNVQTEMVDPGSLLHFYRRLLAFRKASPVLLTGSWRAIASAPDDVLAFVRELDGEAMLVVINTGGEPRVMNLSRAHTTTDVLFATHPRESKSVNLASFAVEPHEGYILQATGLTLP